MRSVRCLSSGALALAAVGCWDTTGDHRGVVAQRAELGELGRIYAVATSLGRERGAEARYLERAARATGALLVPFVDGAGAPALAVDGTRLRGTCGVTFVAPSYAVTAGHCLDAALADRAALQVELYRPTAALDEGFLAMTDLGGTFPAFTHGRLGGDEGYHVDRYPCTVVASCGSGYGERFGCPADVDADVALVRCAGEPGARYGYVEVAAADDPEAAPVVAWKHELYAAPTPTAPTAPPPVDDRFDHYVVLTSYAESYHYFGVGPDGVERNQLLPLVSVDFADGTPHRKNSYSSSGVSTDLFGCHGTSGSGVFQATASGALELLGPVNDGNPEHDRYLCNHVPSLDGMTREPGAFGIGYAHLAAVTAMLGAHTSELDADRAALGEVVPGGPNGFDTFAERERVVLRDRAEPGAPPMPARFVGDGREGFAALLLADEELVLTLDGATADLTWLARLTVSGGTPACGLRAADGTTLVERDCEAGLTHFGQVPTAPTELYLRAPAGAVAVVVDELTVASSAAPDQDGDGVADLLDACPDGNPVATGALAVGPFGERATHAVCLPLPTGVWLEVPAVVADCGAPVLTGHITEVNGVELGPDALVVAAAAPTVTLPLGEHVVTWEIDGAGAGPVTVTQRVQIEEVATAACCPAGTATEGTAAGDALFVGSAACVLAGTGADFARVDAGTVWGGEGADYLRVRGGVGTLVGGAGDDYLTGEDGVLTVLGGPGADTIHATHATSAVIRGGPGADTILGSPGGDVVYAGSGTRTVATGPGDDTVILLDPCELTRGAYLDGGSGADLLVVPVDPGEVASHGVEVRAFEQVLVDDSQRVLSDCFGSAP